MPHPQTPQPPVVEIKYSWEVDDPARLVAAWEALPDGWRSFEREPDDEAVVGVPYAGMLDDLITWTANERGPDFTAWGCVEWSTDHRETYFPTPA